MTDWTYEALIVTTNLELARNLAVIAAPFPAEAEAERNNFPDTPNTNEGLGGVVC